MKQEDINALKSLARKCVAEINKAWADSGARTQKQKDSISREVLLRHEKRIAPKFTLPYLNYYIGIHTGVLKERT